MANKFGAGYRFSVKLRRLGIFGGTFDPIHLGHLRVALEAKEAFGLETVHFVPSYRAPHKATGGVAASADRFAMTSLAVKGVPGFVASGVETRRPVPSYTVETLGHFRDRYPAWERFFLVGLDAFLEIHTWKDYESLFSLARFVVMSRPGPAGPGEKAVEAYVSSRLAPILEKAGDKSLGIGYFQTTGLDISSSAIRAAVSSGRSVRFLVTDAVFHYINEKGLYL